MSTETLERPMAKPQPKPTESVRVDAGVMADCRIAAAYVKKTLAEYISDHMREIAKRDIEAEHAKRSRPDRKPK